MHPRAYEPTVSENGRALEDEFRVAWDKNEPVPNSELKELHLIMTTVTPLITTDIIV